MRQRPTQRRRLLVITLVVVGVAIVYAGIQAFVVEPDSLVVVEYALELDNWPAGLEGFRIAATGDIHGGAPYIDERKLQEVARRITLAKPDLIVWLGDYVIQEVIGGTFMEPERIAEILARAEARYGHLAIIGNHDRWLDSERVERAFQERGIPFARWEDHVITANGVRVHLYGLDDFELSKNYWGMFKIASEHWKTIAKGEPLILLSHNPDVLPFVPPEAALTLAAHTHGGQARFPLLGSPIVPSSFGQRYARGLITEGGRHMFVNTGIGTSIIPVRFSVPPEISILTLRRKDAR
jgi:predicted MPP superfamily phosphohydrolase